MTELSTHGVTVELPPGFEGRGIRRAQAAQAQDSQAQESRRAQSSRSAATALTTDTANAIVHASTVPLPPEVGDFGSNIVELLGPDDVFVAVFEYGSEAADTPLFAQQGIPRSLELDAFSPSTLQRTLRGQSGAQGFFTEAGRAFCVYAVLGADTRRAALVDKVNALLATLRIEPLDNAGGIGPGAQPPTSTTTAPLGTVADVIGAQADLRTLSELLDTVALRDVIAGSGPFTVFAAHDDAFAAMGLDALRADPALLRRTLEYHVVTGDVHVDALQPGQTLPTLAGPSVTIGETGTPATVDGATLVRPDLDASNGVVHVIDRVLEPPR